MGLALWASPPKEIYTSQKYYEALYRDFPVGMAFVDKEGHFQYANGSFCSFLGRNEEELKKIHWQDITATQDIDIDEAAANKIISGDDKTYTIFKQYIHKRGDYLWARLTVIGIRNTDGTFDHFVKIIEPLASSVFLEAEISTKLKDIQTMLERLKSAPEQGFVAFFASHWTTLIPWAAAFILAIGGVLFRIQNDSKRIQALEEQIREKSRHIHKTE